MILAASGKCLFCLYAVQAPQQEGGSAGAHLNGDGEDGRADGHGKATAGQEHTGNSIRALNQQDIALDELVL